MDSLINTPFKKQQPQTVFQNEKIYLENEALKLGRHFSKSQMTSGKPKVRVVLCFISMKKERISLHCP